MKQTIAAARRRLAAIYEVDDSPARIVPMEGLRGLAVILVFFVHYEDIFGSLMPDATGVGAAGAGAWVSGPISDVLGKVGNTGVDLFFVISGFLVYSAVMRHSRGYGAFVWRRIVRIYPTFIAVLLVYLALTLAAPGHDKMPDGSAAQMLFVAQNFLLLPGLGVGQPLITASWSLTFEFVFYMTLPLLVSILRLRRWSGDSCAIAIAAASLAGLVLSQLVFVSGYSRMVMFGAGMLVAESFRRGAQARTQRRDYDVAALVLLALGLFMVADGQPGWPSFASKLVLFVAFAALVRRVSAGGPIARLLSWAPLRYLGNMSYSYYLIHGLALLALGVILKPDRLPDSALLFWALMPAAFAATWLAATGLFLAIEKPISLKGDRLAGLRLAFGR